MSSAAAFESAGPGGNLQWQERRDGHWHAEGPGGGHFDLVPVRRGFHLWWRPRGGPYVDLGPHGSLGSAFAAARFYLDEGVPARTAAEGATEDRPALRWAEVSFDLASDAEKFARAIEKRGRGVTALRTNLIVTTNATWGDIQHVLERGSWEKGYRVTSSARKFDMVAEEDRSAMATEAGCCGDDKCAHRHPPSVPSSPCEAGLEWQKLYDSKKITIYRAPAGLHEAYYVDQQSGRKWKVEFHDAARPPIKVVILGRGLSLERAKEIAEEHHRARQATRHLPSEAGESVANAPAPMHIEIPPEAYKAWVEFGDRIGPLDTTEKIYRALVPTMNKQDQEVFVVVVMDLHFKLRSVTEVARGERSRVGVGIEEVMRAAIMTPGGAHFLAMHQHPTGKCTASPADKRLHADIERAATTYASLTYLDHVVIGVGEYYSIREGKRHRVS